MKLAELSIKEVSPSDSNTRTDYNGTDMAELVKSIESVGLLNPIIVRKVGDMGYEIVAGHRRFHALKKMGKETIPARVMEATEEDAAQIRLIENLHRKDLNPIEEAKAFHQLFDDHLLTAEAIAQRADKSVAYVTRALALLSLHPKTQELIANGFITAAHGHQIARVEGKQRQKIEAYATTKDQWSKQYPTLVYLKNEIEKNVEKDLTHAVFPKDVEKYGGTETPACTACPWNTGNQNALFDGAQKGSCTNPGCFTKRTNFAFNGMRDNVLMDLPKITFIGFSSDPGYHDAQDVKGYPILAQTATRMKDVRLHPEKYGFSIRKTNRYDAKSKASVVVVSLDKKEQPSPQRGEQKDWEKERFVQGHVHHALIDLADTSVKKLQQKHLVQMMEAPEPKEVKALMKAPFDDVLKALWLNWLGNWQVAEKLEAVGIKTSELVKTTTKEAEAVYADQKAKTQKEKKQ